MHDGTPPQWGSSPEPGPGGPAPAQTLGPQVFCFACGSQIDARAEICPRCGVRQRVAAASTAKSKVTAGLLAIFVGGLGVHKFYLGKSGQGVIYLLFCWTLVPSIIAFIEGLIYLTTSDEQFARQYG